MLNKKIISLDLGDSWVGIASTDSSGSFVYPREAIKSFEIKNFLKDFLIKNEVECVVIGYPITMQGKESDQTKKILNLKKEFEEIFKNVKFFLQDERLSSKFANKILKENKKSKSSEHSIAACIILENFLLKYKKEE